MVAKLLTEFIGTFFLVLSVCLTLTQGLSAAPIAIGAVLMVLTYMGGHISGAHYNPALSLAAMMRGSLRDLEILPYWLFQILGALAGAYISQLITGASIALSPPDAINALSIGPWLVEILFTFVLVLVFLNSTTSSGTVGNSFYGLAVGFMYGAAILAGGAISGGAFNPAVGVGPNLIDGLSTENLILHVVGPLIGAAFATLVFRIQEGYVARTISS